MKNKITQELNRKEDLLAKATIIVDGTEINDVPCKIYLPDRIYEKPFIILKPSSEGDTRKIGTSNQGTLKANCYSFNKEIHKTIESPITYFLPYSIRYWGDGISDCTVPGEPQDLHIVDYLKDSDHTEVTNIEFWISDHKLLEPFISPTYSYTGEVKCERSHKLVFSLSNDVSISFDKHFNTKAEKNGEVIQWSYLVACADLSIPANDAISLQKNILPLVDDFLLIASFAARRRTACLGWTANDKNFMTKFYRGNYSFPTDDYTNDSIHNGLIDISLFQHFMEKSYSSFSSYANKLALRSALYYILPSHSYTVETLFLRLFAGLETLILDFKRKKNLEFVISVKNDWKKLRKYISNCLEGSSDPQLEPDQIVSISNKLDELNRVSLREAFDAFCIEYSINLSDLWPVFGTGKSVGLANIRNKLIHGDPIPHDLFHALIVSKEHLICILERVILRVLQWDVIDSKVSPNYLQTHNNSVKEMPYERSRLSEYINDSR